MRNFMDNIDVLSFEAAFAALETTLSQLESGSPSLEESLALFERGRALAARCQKLLDSAELRVRQLDEHGKASPL
jgi:exodeoxyribonuclease VII small subunit